MYVYIYVYTYIFGEWGFGVSMLFFRVYFSLCVFLQVFFILGSVCDLGNTCSIENGTVNVMSAALRTTCHIPGMQVASCFARTFLHHWNMGK